MSYSPGDPVQHVRGWFGTVTRPAQDHTIVWVRRDGETEEQQVFPECVQPFRQPAQVNTHDLWERTVRR